MSSPHTSRENLVRVRSFLLRDFIPPPEGWAVFLAKRGVKRARFYLENHRHLLPPLRREVESALDTLPTGSSLCLIPPSEPFAYQGRIRLMRVFASTSDDFRLSVGF